MHVLEHGQEALIRRMLAPELPPGWGFIGAQIEEAFVRARYAHHASHAEVLLVHGNAAAQKGSIGTANLRVTLRASPGAPDAHALFKRVLLTIREHEHELRWSLPGRYAVEELAARGCIREALDLADSADTEPRFALSAARIRVSFHDDANAARNARVALTAESIADRLAAAEVLAQTGNVGEALAATRTIVQESAAVLQSIAALHRTCGEHEAAIALYERVGTPHARVALAHYCAWRGDSAGARRHAEAVSDSERDEATLLFGIASALEGAHGDALARFDEVTARRPYDPTPALWRAECLMHLGELERARKEAHRARDLTRDGTSHVPALVLRAAILARLGLEEPVEPVLAEAMKLLSPGAPTNWALALHALRGNRGEPTTHVRDDGTLEHISLVPGPRAVSKYALWRFAATADTDEAERDFDRVHAIYPGVPEPYNYRGELWLYLGDPVRARACFDRALAIYPQSRWAFIGLAGVELLEDRPERALASLARGEELSGGPGPTTFVYRGESHRRLGNRAAARTDLEHSVQLNPSRIGAWVNLALLHAEEGDLEALERTMTVLRTRAPGLVADATEALGQAPDEELPREMLRMLRGNRASTCVTYFTRAGTVRTVPASR